MLASTLFQRWLPVTVGFAVLCPGCVTARRAQRSDEHRLAADLESVTQALNREREKRELLERQLDAAIERTARDHEARLDAERTLKDSQVRVHSQIYDLKAKEEQLTACLIKAKRLEEAIPAHRTRPGPVCPFPGPDIPKIDGQVTGIQRKGDDVFVKLNVGTNSGVKVGTLFILYSDDWYKGDMTVTEAHSDSSFGRLTARGPHDVAIGDKATTTLEDID